MWHSAGANQQKYAKLLRTWAEMAVFPPEVFQRIKEEAAEAAQAEREKKEREREHPPPLGMPPPE